MKRTAAMFFALALGCQSAERNGDVIIIGAAVPLTGKQAKAGGYYRQGYELAVQDHNQRGGLQIGGVKLPVKLVLYDDKSDAATSVSLLERLVNVDGAVALLSGYSTPLVQAQVVVAEKYGLPYLNAGGASKPIFKPGNRWVFGLLTPVERLAETTLDWLASEQDRTRLKQPARVALAWQNTDHGREYRAGVSGWLARHPGRFELVLDEPFEHLAKDHTALIVKVKTSAADVFLSDAHEPDYVLQHRAYVEQRLRHAVVSYGARGPEKSAREALGEHVDYIVAAQWWSPELRYPESRRFSEAFEKAYGEEPNEFYAALAYEGARTLIDAIQRADSLDADAIQKALAASDRRDSLLPGKHVAFPVASRFQIDNPCVLVQNQPGGEVAIIYPLDAATAEAVIPPAP